MEKVDNCCPTNLVGGSKHIENFKPVLKQIKLLKTLSESGSLRDFLNPPRSNQPPKKREIQHLNPSSPRNAQENFNSSLQEKGNWRHFLDGGWCGFASEVALLRCSLGPPLGGCLIAG